MSAKETIGRLQELLERVQTRAQEPRTNGAAPMMVARAQSAAPAPVAEAPAAQAYPTAPPSAQATQPPPAQATQPPPPAYPTPSPAAAHVEAAHVSAPPQAYADSHDDADSDVEISTETVEVDIDIDEPMPMESGAQPVAQQTMPPDDLEDEAEELPMATQPSASPPQLDEELTQEVTQMTAPANEIEEPAPSSSRRPIAAEEVAETYGEESAPRHTPPPESGKQVAAPSVHPSVRPSAAPPSLEGHTLIGGWREPGLGAPQIPPAAGGVRIPSPPPMVTALASGTRLSPDVTRPDLAAGGANIATFEGAPVPKPTTMGELLDLTLAL